MKARDIVRRAASSAGIVLRKDRYEQGIALVRDGVREILTEVTGWRLANRNDSLVTEDGTATYVLSGSVMYSIFSAYNDTDKVPLSYIDYNDAKRAGLLDDEGSPRFYYILSPVEASLTVGFVPKPNGTYNISLVRRLQAPLEVTEVTDIDLPKDLDLPLQLYIKFGWGKDPADYVRYKQILKDFVIDSAHGRDAASVHSPPGILKKALGRSYTTDPGRLPEGYSNA